MELKNIRLANWQVFFYELFLNLPVFSDFFWACPRLERLEKRGNLYKTRSGFSLQVLATLKSVAVGFSLHPLTQNRQLRLLDFKTS